MEIRLNEDGKQIFQSMSPYAKHGTSVAEVEKQLSV